MEDVAIWELGEILESNISMKYELKSPVEKRPKWRFWKISSFVRVIGFGFIPNIRKIDNKVEEEERKKEKKKLAR